jgi:lipopolysaccharide transport system permease protein
MPLFLLPTLLGATGTSRWLCALNVRYRDFVYAMPFLVQAWMFASPMAYAGKLTPVQWRWLYSLNPAVAYIEDFRSAPLGRSTLSPLIVATTTVVSLLAFVSGAFVFRRVERSFADVV